MEKSPRGPRVATCCLLAWTLSFAALGAQAQDFVFGTATLATGSTPVAVARGDFNGDGLQDLVVSNSGSNTISVFLSKANGTYSPKTDYAITTPGQIVVADFNLDGKLDLAVATGTNLEILLGNGDGTFKSPAAQGIAATALAVADFNLDGKPDLFVASTASGLYLGNGDGTFTLSGSTLGSYAWVSEADFNNDGKPDVLLTNSTGGQAFLGNGTGGFTTAGTLTQGSGQAAVADFNRDGKLDVAIAYTPVCVRSCHYYVDIYLGNGDGTFTLTNSQSVLTTPLSLATGDFNQDGKPDLLLTQGGILLGNGDGTFQSALTAPLGITPAGAITGDFNNDGQLDIAAIDKAGWLYVSVGNKGIFGASSTVSSDPVYLGPNTVFADINGDGKLDLVSYGSYPDYGVIVQLGNGDGTFQPAIITAAGSSTGALAVGDFNNDGKLDVAVSGPPGSSQTYSVFLGNGDGTFQAPLSGYSNSYILSIAAVDVNHDGKLDMVATMSNSTSTVNVYLGNGDGTFGTPIGTTVAGCSSSMAVADFNSDGIPDVALSCGSLKILLGNGDGTFKPYISSGSSTGSPVIAGDFNGDGKTDVAAGTTIFLGNGDGTFLQQPSLPSVTVMGMTGGDFDGDGKTDLAMVIYPTSTNLTRLFLSNGDGTFRDSFLIASPASGMATADLNGDGTVDFYGNIPSTPNTTAYTGLNAPVASFAPGPLNFPNEAVGSTESLNLTVSNSGIAQLSLGTTTITGDFAVASNGCTGTLTQGASCTIQVSFTPAVLGLRTGVLTVSTDSFGGTATLALSGNGAVSGPAVQLSSSSLTFPGQMINTKSTSQIVTVTNSGSGAVTISNIATTGDFAQTNNCPSTLNPSASCVAFVTFTPTATGTRTGSLVITDNAGSQTVTLTGSGTAPAVSLSTTKLTFATQGIGTKSAGQTVTLTNTGTATLTVTSVTITGTNASSYSETNSCSSVAAGKTCTITVFFTPAAINSLAATLNVNDNASGSPQTVSLTGTGTDISVPVNLKFGSVTVGTKGSKNVTVRNLSENSVSITSITITGTNAGDFTETNICPSSLGGGKTCTVTVTFQPAAKGSRSATLNIADTGGGSPQTTSLSGTGK
jgi:hypothetical protein